MKKRKETIKFREPELERIYEKCLREGVFEEMKRIKIPE